MADTSIFEVQPPAWLSRLYDQNAPLAASAGRTAGSMLGASATAAYRSAQPGGGSFLDQFPEAMHEGQDPLYPLRVEAMRSQILTTQLQRAAMLQSLKLKNDEAAAFQQDIPALQGYMNALGKDPMTPVPLNLTSGNAIKLATQIQAQAARGVQAKSYADSVADYRKRVSAAIKDAPEFGQSLFVPPAGYPTEQQFNTLTQAESAAATRRAAAREKVSPLAQLQADRDAALMRGDMEAFSEIDKDIQKRTTPVEKVSPLATLQRDRDKALDEGDFKKWNEIQDQIDQMTGKATVPLEVLALPGGEVMYRNPKTGHFSIRNPKTNLDLTHSQMLSLANTLPMKDPARKMIMDSLTATATNQIANPRPAPAPGNVPGLSTSDFDQWLKQRQTP